MKHDTELTRRLQFRNISRFEVNEGRICVTNRNDENLKPLNAETLSRRGAPRKTFNPFVSSLLDFLHASALKGFKM
jgi:hypothetical protein